MGKSGARSGNRTSREWQPYRSMHRAKSHRAVHEDATDVAAPPVLEHADVPAESPQLLDRDEPLRDLIAELREAGSFGYDSEFIGEHTYHTRICLIQVATTKRVALIDPLGDIDLTPFWELIADPAVETVVHAGVPDLEPVVRHTGLRPQNVFDTQIAAAFIGEHYPCALGRLADSLTGADLGKGLKFSQWDQRPLSAAQVVYAANDVRYLPLLRDVIRSKLTALDRVDWAKQECDTLCDAELYKDDLRAAYARFRGGDVLSHRQQGVLIALIAWRDGVAREHDVQPRSLVRDDVLASIARAAPVETADLKHVRGLPRPVREHYASDIISAVAGAGKGNPFAKPDYPHWRTEELKPAIDALLHAVREVCEKQAIAVGIVCSRKDVTRMACLLAEGQAAAGCRLLNGWRWEMLRPTLKAWSQAHALALPDA